MNRNWGRALVLMAGALCASAVAPACASNDQSVFIRQVMAPPQNRTGGACTYTADPQQAALFEGSLDVGVRDNYIAVLLFGNQLSSRGDRTANRAESNRVLLNGAIVKVIDPVTNSTINEFTSTGTGVADPLTGDQPNYGLLSVIAIDAETKRRILAQFPAELAKRDGTKLLIANVKAFGQTLGGVDVETNEYQLPIRVCNGCSITFAGANDVNQQPNPNCKAALSEQAVLPCRLGQDETTPCQLCAGRPLCDDPLLP